MIKIKVIVDLRVRVYQILVTIIGDQITKIKDLNINMIRVLDLIVRIITIEDVKDFEIVKSLLYYNNKIIVNGDKKS